MSHSFDLAGPIPGHHIEIRDMYNMANKDGESWGIGGYRVPREYLDSKLMKEARDGSHTKSPPKATKKGDFLSNIQKVAASLPSPCQYNVTKPWVDETKKPKAPKNVSNRTTYIEQIGIDAKRRPIPGVGAYDLVKDEKDKKVVTTKVKGSDRMNFLEDFEYLANSAPGPGNYNPRDIQPKIKENKTKPDDWIKKHAAELKSPKKIVSADVGAYTPQPVAYMTFDRILEKHIAGKGAAAAKTWGTEVRFSPEKKTKHPTIIPGPGQYNLTATWAPESPGKGGKDGKGGESNVFNKITTGITKSIYYS